jgi:hypothetical protein
MSATMPASIRRIPRRIDAGINTIYMQAALDYLQQQSQEISQEDEESLSLLFNGYINVLGHYSFILAEQIMKAQLRPLNQLAETLVYS